MYDWYILYKVFLGKIIFLESEEEVYLLPMYFLYIFILFKNKVYIQRVTHITI